MKPPTPERLWWVIEPDKDIACPHCDFSSGYRGGSTCGKCGGTGIIKERDYFGQESPSLKGGKEHDG